ncbi:hypothetical protein [Herbaspirillum rubrisubalbicans]|nr:hypothetical protein [Herbaspirillum rubrisubalbicans]ALU89681.1 hypothetical protein Hrubri_2496 [Herbaspirillum rubrisubalbicans M1]
MHPDFKVFIRQYLGVIFAALLPVIAVTFLSLPFNLAGHSGQSHAMTAMTDFHLI